MLVVRLVKSVEYVHKLTRLFSPAATKRELLPLLGVRPRAQQSEELLRKHGGDSITLYYLPA